MDWLGECVEGALPQYEILDVKTRGLDTPSTAGQPERDAANQRKFNRMEHCGREDTW